MVNYANSKIYKIEPINGEQGDFMIGSTTKKYLSQRMVDHKCIYNKYLKGNTKYKSLSSKLFERYGVENCKITYIDSVIANSKDELMVYEQYYKKILGCRYNNKRSIILNLI